MRIMTGELARRVGLPNPWLPFCRDDKNKGRRVYPRVAHELSEEQIHKVADAIGDGSDWPRHTDDPRANFAVDCLVSYEWPERPSFEELEPMYLEEVATFKDREHQGSIN